MDDVYAIELLFADGLVSLVVSLAKIVGIWVSIFILDYWLGLSLFLLIPLIALITRAFQKAMLKAQIANREVLNEESNHLSETSDNFRLLKDLGKEKYRENAFVQLLKKGYKSQDKTSFFDSVYSPTIDFLKSILIAFFAFLVAYSYSSQTLALTITIGSFAAAMELISSIFSPIQAIGEELQSMDFSAGLREDAIVDRGLAFKVAVDGFLRDVESAGDRRKNELRPVLVELASEFFDDLLADVFVVHYGNQKIKLGFHCKPFLHKNKAIFIIFEGRNYFGVEKEDLSEKKIGLLFLFV